MDYLHLFSLPHITMPNLTSLQHLLSSALYLQGTKIERKMLLTFFAVSVDTPEKAASTSHVKDVISVLTDLCFGKDLLKTRIKKEDCRLMC